MDDGIPSPPHSLASLRNHICVYCGAAAQSRDHVPPKAWFARDVRTRIRVPSCNACNHGRSKTDDEFRVILGFLAGVKTPTQRELWRKASKTLRHSPGLRTRFLTQVFTDEKTGQSGIALSRSKVDDAMARVVKGLHWHHHKEMVDLFASVQVWHLKSDSYAEIRNTLVLDLRSDHVGHDQFEYMHGRPIDKPSVSLWLLAFYRSAFFAVVTGHEMRNA